MVLAQIDVTMTSGQWGSVAAIVVAVCLLMEFVKKYIGNMKWFDRVPVFVYVTALSLVGVFVTRRFFNQGVGLATLIWDTLSCALSSSGFYTWLRQARQPLQTATGTVTGKKLQRRRRRKR